ncbi:hypothetical protein DRV85_01540 [Rhodosalinus halophilus]|uniref:Dynamin N-terminal domain-containing protein n=1 Tax=Rhodosalinus halophilus TaxID=2259333 RepID=A0A365UF97_9RHOB|nr:dynamin family protein [Rhodosalinus halophilus]RBI87634.1 hypothetical protein DRV85_01540 [Rhodosalinus halophilus]
MNAEAPVTEEPRATPPRTGLLARAFGELHAYSERLRAVDAAIETLAGQAEGANEVAARKLRRQIREFEPGVTMIGQVKAGKTTLVNAMIGWPGLLPADINPWTSVVTSLHMEPAARGGAQAAKFRFFTEEEWSRLLTKGGRIGELARRAGADQELEKVRRQLNEMRETSRRRLGRKFEMLLGQTHDYGYFDEDLIQRYVCLGDAMDADSATDRLRGRFADITRSADLYLGQPEMPMRLCIRDTPGVNDTFMIREQITINAIRDSRLCVLVLSAHQALSTVDMALIRLISNIRARQVVIFVNRIDELSDPVRDIPEIRESIRATLKAHDGPEDAEIIFGSAHWAIHALQGAFEGLGLASAETLLKWAEHQYGEEADGKTVEEVVWELSGLPALCGIIARRVRTGEGAEFEERVTRAARNLATSMTATRNIVSRRVGSMPVRTISREQIGGEIDAIAERSLEQLDARFDAALRDLDGRLDGARRTFVARATSALARHLETNGEERVWTYDPSGLRVLLRAAYRVFAVAVAKSSKEIALGMTSEIRDACIGAFEIPEEDFALEGPPVPQPPAPISLGKTIALDIGGSWWSRWWRRRRNPQAYAEEFADLIAAEVEPMIAALRTEHAEAYRDAVKASLREFAETQRASLRELAAQTEVDGEELRERVGAADRTAAEAFDASLAVLSRRPAPEEERVPA